MYGKRVFLLTPQWCTENIRNVHRVWSDQRAEPVPYQRYCQAPTWIWGEQTTPNGEWVNSRDVPHLPGSNVLHFWPSSISEQCLQPSGATTSPSSTSSTCTQTGAGWLQKSLPNWGGQSLSLSRIGLRGAGNACEGGKQDSQLNGICNGTDAGGEGCKWERCEQWWWWWRAQAGGLHRIGTCSHKNHHLCWDHETESGLTAPTDQTTVQGGERGVGERWRRHIGNDCAQDCALDQHPPLQRPVGSPGTRLSASRDSQCTVGGERGRWIFFADSLQETSWTFAIQRFPSL